MIKYASGSAGASTTACSKAFRTPKGMLACENNWAMITCAGGRSAFFLAASFKSFNAPSKSRSLNRATASVISCDCAASPRSFPATGSAADFDVAHAKHRARKAAVTIKLANVRLIMADSSFSTGKCSRFVLPHGSRRDIS